MTRTTPVPPARAAALATTALVACGGVWGRPGDCAATAARRADRFVPHPAPLVLPAPSADGAVPRTVSPPLTLSRQSAGRRAGTGPEDRAAEYRAFTDGAFPRQGVPSVVGRTSATDVNSPCGRTSSPQSGGSACSASTRRQPCPATSATSPRSSPSSPATGLSEPSGLRTSPRRPNSRTWNVEHRPDGHTAGTP